MKLNFSLCQYTSIIKRFLINTFLFSHTSCHMTPISAFKKNANWAKVCILYLEKLYYYLVLLVNHTFGNTFQLCYTFFWQLHDSRAQSLSESIYIAVNQNLDSVLQCSYYQFNVFFVFVVVGFWTFSLHLFRLVKLINNIWNILYCIIEYWQCTFSTIWFIYATIL